MILRIEFKSGRLDFSVLSKGFSLKNCVGAAGKHQTATCSIQIHSQIAFAKIMEENSLVKASLIDNGQNVFSGVIRPYFNFTAVNNYINDFSLEILDYTELLHKKVTVSLEDVLEEPIEGAIYEEDLDGYMIASADGVDSVLHHLTSLCGIKDINSPVIDKVLPRLSLKDGDYIDELLEDLLYEYGYDYYFDPDGKMVVYSTDTENTTITKIQDLRGSLSLKRSDVDYDGTTVTYPKYKTAEHQQIYYNSWNDQNLDALFGYIVTHQYLPEEESRGLTWDLSKIRSDEGEEIRLSNFSATSGSTGNGAFETIAHLSDCNDSGGKGYVEYWGWYGWTVMGGKAGVYLKVFADVTYLKSESTKIGIIGSNTKEYIANYVYNKEDAEYLARLIHNRNRCGSYTLSFSSRELLKPGQICEINEPKITGLLSKVRVLSRRMTEYTPYSGIYEYEAESCGEVSALTNIDIDNDQALNPDLEDFFELTCSHYSIYTTDNIAVLAKVSGSILSTGFLNWYINDVKVSPTGDTPTTLSITQAQLKVGSNTVMAAVSYEGNIYTKKAIITLVDSSAPTAQYAWGTSRTVSPAPGNVWIWNNALIIYNQKLIGNITSLWTDEQQPRPSKGEWFLWMRWKYGGSFSDPICLAPQEEVSYTISSSQSTFSLSSRGLVIVDQKIIFSCEKTGITADAIWIIEEGAGVLIDPQNGVGDTIEITIPAGLQIAYFIIRCEVGTLPAKTIRINGVQSGEAKPTYLGVYVYPAIKPSSTSEGDLIEGDYLIYIDEDGNESPQVWKNKEWEDVDGTESNYSEIMGLTLGDVIRQPDIEKVNAAHYGFFGNLASFAAFIIQLYVRNLKIEGEIPGTGLEVKIYAQSDDGKPVFDVLYDSKIIFKIDPQTGNIFFGEPLEDLSGPKSGFMYNSADEALVGPKSKFKLQNDGTIGGSAIQFLAPLFDASFIFDKRFFNSSDIKEISYQNTAEENANIIEYYFEKYSSFVKPISLSSSNEEDGCVLFLFGLNDTNSVHAVAKVDTGDYLEYYIFKKNRKRFESIIYYNKSTGEYYHDSYFGTTKFSFVALSEANNIINDTIFVGNIEAANLKSKWHFNATSSNTHQLTMRIGDTLIFGVRYTTSGSGTATSMTVSFPAPFEDKPLVLTNYEKSDDTRDGYNYGFVMELTTTYVKISVYRSFPQQLFIIGKINGDILNFYDMELI